ncbi:MAG TPA: dihydrofolate reductase family protein [Candidatus Sulfotelmatobacter sp.]|nr:dihydrofolate reductase family protein [Candidatus Sulfotelmatobacter sp.]
MLTSVFVGTSVDGFLARPNGALDFLDVPGIEPHGYTEFIATVDVIVIGRLTFEIVLAFPEWPYGEKQVVVLSSGMLDFSKLRGARVEQMSGSPAEIVSALSTRGFQHAYIDGGVTVQRFLRAGAIQRLTITRVPVLIGQGIPLFGSLPHDVKLRHVSTHPYPSGLVKTEYQIE